MDGEDISGKDCFIGGSPQDSRKSRSKERNSPCISRICGRSFRRDVTPYAYLIDEGGISDNNEPFDGNRNSSSLQNSHSMERRSNLGIPVDNNRPLRRKPSLSWDVPPHGFEHTTPLQYKARQATGQIPSIHDIMQTYNRNLYFGVTEEEIVNFFKQETSLSGAQAERNSVLAHQTHMEENFPFSEVRSINETIQRMLSSNSDVISSVVNDSAHKIFIGGIPNYLNHEQVKKILLSFGLLRAFNLVKDADTGLNKGHAFAEYMDLNVTDQAIAGLNGMQLGDKKLTARRARFEAKSTTVEEIKIQVPGIAIVGNSGSPKDVECILDIELLEDKEEDEHLLEDCILILFIIIELLWLAYLLYEYEFDYE